jgi:hypothetical protein
MLLCCFVHFVSLHQEPLETAEGSHPQIQPVMEKDINKNETKVSFGEVYFKSYFTQLKSNNKKRSSKKKVPSFCSLSFDENKKDNTSLNVNHSSGVNRAKSAPPSL